MPNALQIPEEFSETLDQLTHLSRNHLLFFRLEVGKLLLQQFFGGDAAAYQSFDPTKPQGFGQFTATCAEQLADIGLGEQVLRQCIVAHIVVKSLPHATVAKLGFTQVVELTRVPDAATRSLLAQASAENNWTGKQLKGAIEAAKAKKWIDVDPKTPGLQPPEPTPKHPPEYSAANPPHAGRVVARFERTVEDFKELTAQWDLVVAEKLSDGQKARVKAAVAELMEGLGKVDKGQT